MCQLLYIHIFYYIILLFFSIPILTFVFLIYCHLYINKRLDLRTWLIISIFSNWKLNFNNERTDWNANFSIHKSINVVRKQKSM